MDEKFSRYHPRPHADGKTGEVLSSTKLFLELHKQNSVAEVSGENPQLAEDAGNLN